MHQRYSHRRCIGGAQGGGACAPPQHWLSPAGSRGKWWVSPPEIVGTPGEALLGCPLGKPSLLVSNRLLVPPQYQEPPVAHGYSCAFSPPVPFTAGAFLECMLCSRSTAAVQRRCANVPEVHGYAHILVFWHQQLLSATLKA